MGGERANINTKADKETSGATEYLFVGRGPVLRSKYKEAPRGALGSDCEASVPTCSLEYNGWDKKGLLSAFE